MLLERLQLVVPSVLIAIYLIIALLFDNQIGILLIFFAAVFGVSARFFLIERYQFLNIMVAVYIMVDFVFRGIVFEFGPAEIVSDRLGYVSTRMTVYILVLVMIVHELVFLVSDIINRKRFVMNHKVRTPHSTFSISPSVIIVLTILGLAAILYNSTLYDYSLGIEDNIGHYYMVPLMGIFYASISLVIYYLLFYGKYSSLKRYGYVGLLLSLPVALMLINPSKAQAFRPIFFTLMWLTIILYRQRRILIIYMFGLLPLFYGILIWLKKWMSSIQDLELANIVNFESVVWYMDWLFNRFYGLDMLLAIFKYIDEQSLKFGSTFIEVLYFWIPRSIWHEKPLSVTYEIGYELQPYLMGEHSGGFVAPTLIGEFVINFGLILGVLMYAIVLVALLSLTSRTLSGKPLLQFLFPVLVFHLLFTLAGGLAPHLAMALADIIPYALVLVLAKKREYHKY